jgi:hypothetical protein
MAKVQKWGVDVVLASSLIMNAWNLCTSSEKRERDGGSGHGGVDQARDLAHVLGVGEHRFEWGL